MSKQKKGSEKMEPEYEIEKILGEKYDARKKTTLYHVKWRGWPDEENTWEARQDLIDDGYEDALRKYDEEKLLRTPPTTKQKSTARSGARSKTPVKRTAAAKDGTPEPKKKKASSTSPDKPKSAKKERKEKSPAKPREKSPSKPREKSPKPSSAKKSRSKSPETSKVTPVAQGQTPASWKDAAIAAAGFGLSARISTSQAFLNTFGESTAILIPLVVALVVVRFVAQVHSVASRASNALLWAIAAYLFAIPAFQAPDFIKNLSIFLWRYFFARAVGADTADREVLFATIASWYAFVYTPAFGTLTNLAALASVWAIITTVERWTLNMTTVNLIEALASAAVLFAQFSSAVELVWLALGLLTLSAVTRTSAPYM